VIERAGRARWKFRHGVALVFGLFVAGTIPLLVSFFGSPGALEAEKIAGRVSTGDQAGNASPLKRPAYSAAFASAEDLSCPTTDLRLLVVAANGEESTLPAIREVLDYLGTPYTVYVAREDPGGLTPERLSDGCRGFYSGVILTNGNLPYSAASGETESALTEEEWAALSDYEREFDVRRVAWYAYPNAEYGFRTPERVDTTDAPITTSLTEAGRGVFGYLQPDIELEVRDAFAYLAGPLDGDTEPLLVDGEGNALAAVKTYPDGRERLALTFDSSPRLLHTKLLAHGLVDWVSDGLFLGERRVYMSAQIDDLFLPTELANGGTYRISGDDLGEVLDWQEGKQEDLLTENLRLDMAYNAYGTTGLYSPDTLTPLVDRTQREFKWISHTYKHLDLDEVDYSTALSELRENARWAERSELGSFDADTLVTPEYSGLENPQVVDAAHEAGIRYIVGDESIPGYGNPSPNAGLYHPRQPSILLIPRYATNLFFDVSTPGEWVSEYNERYRDFWGRNLNYDEVLERESDVLLAYLLEGDVNPLMFHQANLRAYDGTHTLLGDLLDRTLEKYERLYDLPIQSPTMKTLGQQQADRMRYDQADVQASVTPNGEISITARKDATVPVTGLETQGARTYGGESVSFVRVEAGESVVLPLDGG
jgi:hypothetical protein